MQQSASPSAVIRLLWLGNGSYSMYAEGLWGTRKYWYKNLKVHREDCG